MRKVLSLIIIAIFATLSVTATDKEKKIAGAYRVGKSKDILQQYGIKGFYVQSLFKFDKKMIPTLAVSLELGRSFIIQEYQRKPLSLFLLWKGIFYFLLKNKEYRYLIGPVSISNSFSKFTKSLLVSFVKSNFYNDELAQYIKPRKQFKIPKKHRPEIHCLVDEITNDIDRIDSIVREIEHDKRIPVLLKKYISLNAKIIGFNVDPLFNDCLDGLMILDILNVPKEMIESFSKDLQNEQSEFSKINFLRNRINEDK